MFKKACTIIFVCWLVILLARSIQYIGRIYDEFAFPPENVISKIDVCNHKNSFSNVEEEKLYQYLKVGYYCQ